MTAEMNIGGEVGDSAEQPKVPEGFSEREKIYIETLHIDQIVRFETEDIELDFHVRRPGNLYVLGELCPAGTETGNDNEDSIRARVYGRRYFNKGHPLLIHLLWIGYERRRGY